MARARVARDVTIISALGVSKTSLPAVCGVVILGVLQGTVFSQLRESGSLF